jgi:hypothetical protein
MRTIFSVLTALVLTLAIATSASAQSSVDGYEDQGGQIQAQIQGGGSGGDGDAGSTAPVAATTDSAGGGSLPFTGLDVALLLAAGGVLVVVGLGMRRLTRSPDTA